MKSNMHFQTEQISLCILQVQNHTLTNFQCSCSFHIGSGIRTPETFAKAIAYSHKIFKDAEELGFKFSILDIGGGFPGDELSTGIFKVHFMSLVLPCCD